MASKDVPTCILNTLPWTNHQSRQIAERSTHFYSVENRVHLLQSFSVTMSIASFTSMDLNRIDRTTTA